MNTPQHNTIVLGDCIAVMKSWPDNVVEQWHSVGLEAMIERLQAGQGVHALP